MTKFIQFVAIFIVQIFLTKAIKPSMFNPPCEYFFVTGISFRYFFEVHNLLFDLAFSLSYSRLMADVLYFRCPGGDHFYCDH